MVNVATARPGYIQDKISATQEARTERVYNQFKKENQEAYWGAWTEGGKSMRVKRVVQVYRRTVDFRASEPNPYPVNSFLHRAWEDGFSNAVWEEQMGYDL